MSLRILHAVEFYSPSVGGSQELVKQLSERLAARGHQVTVATSRIDARSSQTIGGVEIEQFDICGNAVRGLEGEVERYQRFVIDGDFDLVMTYSAQQWTTDALLPVIDQIKAPLVLAPCGFSALENDAYGAYFERLAGELPRFDALILHSESYQDARFAREAGATNIHLIPNGADEREFGQLPARGAFRQAHGIGQDEPLVLTVGGHTGLKGHAQAMAAFAIASECSGATLAIVANQPMGLGCAFRCRQRSRWLNLTRRDRRVLLADPPRAEVISAYTDADAFLFCSMVECSPLVLFEAMAAGLPFLSLDVGNAAEIAAWGSCGEIVPSGRDGAGNVTAPARIVADRLDGLLADRELRSEMGANGRSAWQERFTWERITDQYEQLYESLLR